MKRKPKSTQVAELESTLEHYKERVDILEKRWRKYANEAAESQKEAIEGLRENNEEFARMLGRVAQKYGEKVYESGKLIGWRISFPIRRTWWYKWPKTKTSIILKEVYREEESTTEMIVAEVLEDVD